MKTLLHSRTFWLAVVQAVSGIVVVALTELDMAGYVVVFKSIVDILLRLATSDPIDRVI
jgi:uncharacterized membrane protein